ncbi:MAG: alternative ribosome rescue aminoacyl-tRNA hydrolase ArfB [Propionibacteriaceae bacterium]
MDLVVRAGPGLPLPLVIPGAELVERFSRSSGPGGQGVNTTDSRVELEFDVVSSPTLSERQRARILLALGDRVVQGRVVVVASEHRAQRRNRVAARERLAALLREALAPPPPARRATRPTRSSQVRRLEAKRRQALLKITRGRQANE